MNTTHDEVTYARQEDIQGMLELNYKIYPKEWHVSPDYVQTIMKRNDKVYRVIHSYQEIKGIYSLFPLSKEIYDAVLTGKLDEKHLEKYILDYDTPKEVYIYLISIIVDIYDVNRKNYAKSIIKDIPHQLNTIEKMGIKIKEIGAIAISNYGEKILPKIGFQVQNETAIDTNYPVYKAQKSEIIKAIK
jgi:hypothetical protein